MAVRGRIGGSMSASGKASELEFFVGFDPACSPLTGTKLFSSHPLLIASGAKPVVYEWALKQPADLAGLDWLVSASSPQPFPLQGVVLRDRQGADYFDFFCSAEAQAHSPSRAVILEQLPELVKLMRNCALLTADFSTGNRKSLIVDFDGRVAAVGYRAVGSAIKDYFRLSEAYGFTTIGVSSTLLESAGFGREVMRLHWAMAYYHQLDLSPV